MVDYWLEQNTFDYNQILKQAVLSTYSLTLVKVVEELIFHTEQETVDEDKTMAPPELPHQQNGSLLQMMFGIDESLTILKRIMHPMAMISRDDEEKRNIQHDLSLLETQDANEHDS